MNTTQPPEGAQRRSPQSGGTSSGTPLAPEAAVASAPAWRMLIEALLEPVWLVDAVGLRIVAVNQAAAERARQT